MQGRWREVEEGRLPGNRTRSCLCARIAAFANTLGRWVRARLSPVHRNLYRGMWIVFCIESLKFERFAAAGQPLAMTCLQGWAWGVSWKQLVKRSMHLSVEGRKPKSRRFSEYADCSRRDLATRPTGMVIDQEKCNGRRLREKNPTKVIPGQNRLVKSGRTSV